MSQIFTEQGKMIPVTVVEVAPNVVTQVKSKETDGYEAVQVGTGSIKPKNVSKALKGHLKDSGLFQHLREFKTVTMNDQELKTGDTLDLTAFATGDVVKVSGISKGKGFQGGMKRHGFHGMPASHGHKSVKRHIGSIGQRFPQHTLKGKKMAGRMGADRITVRGLKVLTVDPTQGILAISGAVPGQRGALLEIVTQ